MLKTRKPFRLVMVLFLVAVACTDRAERVSAQSPPPELQQTVALPFRFVAFGDTRFTDPADTEAANATARQAIIRAVTQVHPAFVSIGGDIVYNGGAGKDWTVWDSETKQWRDAGIPVYPVLGNHDLKGNEKTALASYFARFPELKGNRYYSVRFANCLMLVLDSDLDLNLGTQADWIKQKLDTVPGGVTFVIIVMHHPPYTSSSDSKKYGGGHSARPNEQVFGKMLEARQEKATVRYVVFTGHVHNYERHEAGGVTYFVTGGGGAHAYPIERGPKDPFQSTEINYHYLLAQVGKDTMRVTMQRLDLSAGSAQWSERDTVLIPSAKPATAVGK